MSEIYESSARTSWVSCCCRGADSRRAESQDFSASSIFDSASNDKLGAVGRVETEMMLSICIPLALRVVQSVNPNIVCESIDDSEGKGSEDSGDCFISRGSVYSALWSYPDAAYMLSRPSLGTSGEGVWVWGRL